MNESFKTDPSLATSARAAKESGSYLCASNVTPTAVRFIVSVFLCLLCSCRMPSTQMTCSHFRKNRPKKRQKPAGCRSRIISKNRPVPIFGRSTGASLVLTPPPLSFVHVLVQEQVTQSCLAGVRLVRVLSLTAHGVVRKRP